MSVKRADDREVVDWVYAPRNWRIEDLYREIASGGGKADRISITPLEEVPESEIPEEFQAEKFHRWLVKTNYTNGWGNPKPLPV